MAAPGKATVQTYRLGLQLLAMRQQAKHGEWLPALRALRISQPTAWRYMRFAARVKAGRFPGAKNLQEQDRILRRIEAHEKKHGRPDLSKLAGAVDELKAGRKSSAPTDRSRRVAPTGSKRRKNG